MLLQHKNIHAALTFIMSSCKSNSSSGKAVDTETKAKIEEELDQVQREAFNIARRMLNWSEYSRSASGVLIRKWCKRQGK